MTGAEHYAEGERLIKDAWDRDAGIDVASITVALAHAHFTAALAYASLETLRLNESRRRIG